MIDIANHEMRLSINDHFFHQSGLNLRVKTTLLYVPFDTIADININSCLQCSDIAAPAIARLFAGGQSVVHRRRTARITMSEFVENRRLGGRVQSRNHFGSFVAAHAQVVRSSPFPFRFGSDSFAN